MTEVDALCEGLLAADIAFWAGVAVMLSQGGDWWDVAMWLVLLPLAVYCAVRLINVAAMAAKRWLASWDLVGQRDHPALKSQP
jgi:hypothetical protein